MRFIGEKLRQMREARGLSMKDLGELTGLAQGYISELENNKKNPRPDKVDKLAKALKIDQQYFYIEESRLPQDVLPDMPDDVRELFLDGKNMPWLVLAAKAKEKGISKETLEKLIDALSD